MFRKAEELHKYTLDAMDGEIGKIKDFYFDDRYWTVRYLVADTGNWLEERLVLISPYALVSVNEQSEMITTNLAKRQIENSPPADSDKPVSRQFEVLYCEHYQWPAYWCASSEREAYPYPVLVREGTKEEEDEQASWDSHLRSVREMEGYGVEVIDGDIGHIADFMIDEKDWAIRYLVVDTRNWWPGKHVLMSPLCIDRVSWDDRKVYVDLTGDTIKDAPRIREEFRHLSRVRDRARSPLQRGGYWTEDGRASDTA